jgi:hypothetical protein
MTLTQALNLQYRDEIHEDECVLNVSPRGKVRTVTTIWRVNGKVRTWSRDPGRIEIPCKHGLREHFTFTERDLASLHLPSECPLIDLLESIDGGPADVARMYRTS